MNKEAKMLLFFAVPLFLLVVILLTGFFSPFPFFRALYQDCSRITNNMSVKEVTSILEKYAIRTGYYYSITNEEKKITFLNSKLYYEQVINVFAEKFEGDCTVYLSKDKVIYIKKIFD